MASIRVEVVYALPGEAKALTVELPAGSLVRDALRAAGMAAQQELLGIYGRRVEPDAPLSDGDRVEIYRPLAMDPKERRRQRARRRR